jgi:cytochrome b561
MTAAAPDEADEETRPHYHPIGITFHWLMAALVFVQLWWGWRTSLLAPGYDKLDAYGVHALIGVAILLLAFLRAGWRSIAPFVRPDLERPEDLPGWQRFAAEATHIGLYALMFALPLTGWLMLSAGAPEAAIALPWDWTWPILPFIDTLSFVERAHLEETAEQLHLALVWIMMALVALHVGAALKHHFIDRDDVLARMIPALSRNRSAGAAANTREASQAKGAM